MPIPALVLEWLARQADYYASTEGDIGIRLEDQKIFMIKSECYREILQRLRELS